MGSVKDLRILKMPSESEMGIGHFNFSDRYETFFYTTSNFFYKIIFVSLNFFYPNKIFLQNFF